MGTLSESYALKTMMLAEWRRLHAVIMYAEALHRGQVDKGGEPYIWHPMRVGISLLPDVDAAIVGLLHDVLEDTDASPIEIERLIGQELFADLDALTHRKETETYCEYLQRVEARPLAKKVKIADITDNLDEYRLARAAKVQGDGFVVSCRLKYQLALASLGGSNVIDFASQVPADS